MTERQVSGEGDGAAVPEVQAQERRLRRDLGFWGLTGIGFSNIVGSGWLFAALYAAQTAGPAALLSWVGAGLLCGLVALVMIELGATRPEGGGTVRWPLFASGRLVGTLIGWSTLLSVGGTAAEISAIMQYAAHYLPGLYNGHTLTLSGLALAAGLSTVLTALNWFAVRMFAQLNNLVSVFKIVIPVVTVIALIASGWHSGRLTDHGGFAPYGYVACLTALAGGGIVYSVNGFQAPLDFSGETRNPRRTIPAAVLTGIGLAVLMYLALQVAFLFTVPEDLLGNGWKGVSFESPFGQLALILNLHWLASLLYADAVISPGGSAYVGVALNARHTYALAKNGTIPRYFMKVNERFGIPRRALAINLVVIMVFLLPFGGWQDIVSVMGDMYLLIYAASAVAVAVFRAEPGGRTAGWVPGAGLDRAAQLRGGQRVRLLVGLARPAPRPAPRTRRPADLPGHAPPRRPRQGRPGERRRRPEPLARRGTPHRRLDGGLPGRPDGALLAGHLRGLRPAAGPVRLGHRGRPRARRLLLGRAVRRPASGGGPSRDGLSRGH